SPSFHLLQLYCGLLTLHALPTRRSSDLSARMRPALGATVRSSAATTVYLPDPDGPVSAIRVPGVRSRSTPRTASSAAPGQRTARSSVASADGGATGTGEAGSGTDGGRCSSARSRAAAGPAGSRRTAAEGRG